MYYVLILMGFKIHVLCLSLIRNQTVNMYMFGYISLNFFNLTEGWRSILACIPFTCTHITNSEKGTPL